MSQPPSPAAGRSDAWSRRSPRVWAALLAGLMLGPALGPGPVLSYDMVWVPDLTLRPDFWGLGSGLPRAVPSDAVVAVLDEVLPGALLQKVVLVGSLVGAGLGADRLVRERSGRPGGAAGRGVGLPVEPVRRRAAADRSLADAPLPGRSRGCSSPRTVAGSRPVPGPTVGPRPAGLTECQRRPGHRGRPARGGRGRDADGSWSRGRRLAANAPWLVAGVLHADTSLVGSPRRLGVRAVG